VAAKGKKGEIAGYRKTRVGGLSVGGLTGADKRGAQAAGQKKKKKTKDTRLFIIKDQTALPPD